MVVGVYLVERRENAEPSVKRRDCMKRETRQDVLERKNGVVWRGAGILALAGRPCEPRHLAIRR